MFSSHQRFGKGVGLNKKKHRGFFFKGEAILYDTIMVEMTLCIRQNLQIFIVPNVNLNL